MDRLDTLSQVQAIRLLANSGGPIQAFQEVVLGFYEKDALKKEGGVAPKGAGGEEAGNGGDTEHSSSVLKDTTVELSCSLFVRTEAALALAQCNNCPFYY